MLQNIYPLKKLAFGQLIPLNSSNEQAYYGCYMHKKVVSW